MSFLANLAPFAPILLLSVVIGVGHHRYGRG
ncbi:hypothetical protein MMMDOFMJ_0134 [Methylobacterium gnaphalii]|nr:hypothetical protein MMMDOFMJ_0134 [Methylobacterium gnaphalii]